ncbi:MAG: hypothetical protein HY875_03100 [Chloroflexi bacterium]|nr:hypothetical protein [Chloroflexota bacterium]
MSDGIFVIKGELGSGEEELVEMRQAPYDSEDVLQDILARYPDLLAGGQMNPESPRRWLLIRREQSVPDTLDGAARWSLDHLFVDQEGVPTLIEVKRASDSRIRREVVGQMLDYAANAVAYWPVAEMRAEFEVRHGDQVAAVVAGALGAEVDAEQLWEQVRQNLEAGRVRLVFVADEIPRELRRIVEFMNEQMRAEVLAVEVQQHVGQGTEGLRTMISRVYGLTERAQDQKTGIRLPPRQWDEPSFFAALQESAPEAVAPARALLAWARTRQYRVAWGKGAKSGSFQILAPGTTAYTCSVWTTGRFDIAFGYLLRNPAFESEGARRELAARLESVPLIVRDDQLNMYPAFQLSDLAEGPMARFTETMDGVLSQIRTDIGRT